MKFILVKKLEVITIKDKETKKEKEITLTHFFLKSLDSEDMKLIPILPNKKIYKNGSSFSNADLLSALAVKVD